jgi:NAD(P)-dependent dehydrogenase (short-subunit alcohol dehydrogenase family)
MNDHGARVSIVAGGARGLGEAIALRLARAEQVAAGIRAAGAAADGCAVDVTVEAQVASMVEETVARHGAVHNLVCSAAIEVRKPLLETSDDEWQQVLDVNLKGPFLCMKHAIPQIAAAGGGAVVLMGSTLGHIGQPQFSAYCASKGALVNLCKQAAIEHAPDGVRVNVVSPSATDTGLFIEFARQAPDPEAIVRMVTVNNPAGRLGTGAEVADTVAFLTSSAAAYISGCAIPMDGGLAARRA